MEQQDDKLKFFDILYSDDVVNDINNNLDFIISMIPELRFSLNFDHMSPHHHLNVWQHTLYAISLSGKDFKVRLCLLLHDIGKPFCYTEKDGIRHYRGHGEYSARIAELVLKRFNFKEDFINDCVYIIRNHDNPITKDLINRNYELALTLYKVQCCDSLAHKPEEIEDRKLILNKFKKMFDLKE